MSATPSATVAIGDEREPSVGAPLTITDFVRYQGASGDMNPIHHDAEFARAAGYPAPFAPGMLAAGILAGYAADWLGPANIRRFKVRFREQAWPGDVLTCRGVVVDVRDHDGRVVADLELSCTRQDGAVHVEAWATFVVH